MKISSPNLAVAITLVALGQLGASGCLDNDIDLEASVEALSDDPSTASEGGWCFSKHNVDGTRTRVYYPWNGGCSSSVYSPLVIIMPGFGFAARDYHYLGKHLAKNGFIVSIVETVAGELGDLHLPGALDYQEAANEAWAVVENFMWTSWSKRFFIDPSRVALIGHSRGGEAVRYLTDVVAADPTFDVEAVVGLAGTDHTSNFLGGNRVAALYIHGTKDGDVPIDRSVRAYDRTGSDASQNDPFTNSWVLHRTMKLLVGGDHTAFTTRFEGSFSDIPTQRDATKGYVLAFLKVHLAGDYEYYADYIRGDGVPGAWSTQVYSQTSDGVLNRTIDNFENAWKTINALGDMVQSGGNIDWEIEDLGADALVAHDTLALVVTPNESASWLQWNLPEPKRDADAFRALSVRIGRRGLPGDGGGSIQIANGGIWSPPLELTDYGEIADEVLTCAEDLSPLCLGPAPTIANMSTIRIPLAELGPHDDVTAVRLNFDDEAIGREFLLDSLAFNEWFVAP